MISQDIQGDIGAVRTNPSDSTFARQLRGFGPIGLLAILAILSGNFLFVPLSGLLVLVWANWSETPWHEIGYVRPRSWLASLLIGVTFGVALKLLMKSVVMPLLGAPPVNGPYHYLAGNQAAIPATLFLLTAGAGFGEETVFRGYMFERLGKLLGSSTAAKAMTVVLTAILFGSAHYAVQGVAGMEQATITGLLFGAVFAVTGRLWMLMCAHAAFDLTAYAMIYWDVETRFAHWFFR